MMAIRRLNYTGRQRIARKDVRITLLQPASGSLAFDARLSLDGYKLPEDALVYVEAYRQAMKMRFPFGPISAIVKPVDCALTLFDSEDGLLFRVKVVSGESRPGLLLAEADGIRCRLPNDVEEDTIALLGVKSADLGQEVCRVDFDGDLPVLLIHRSLDKQSVGASPFFRALVCSLAMREILTRILFQEEYPDLDNMEDWKARWLMFAFSLPGVATVKEDDDENEKREWIQDVVAVFAKKARALDQFVASWQKEETR